MPHQFVVAFFMRFCFNFVACLLGMLLFKKINIVCFLCLLAIGIFAQATTFSVDAGPYKKICPGTSALIGGNPTASGGSGKYKYLWHPKTSLSDSIISNPTATPYSTTTYTVLVT